MMNDKLKIKKDDINKPVELLFSVADSGIGIPQNRLQAIFDNFTQVDSSTSRRYGGTGLGLTISKKLVEMMSGKIWVESQVGNGSTFNFTVKFLRSQKTQVGEFVLPENFHGLRVLAVDDNYTNRIIIKEMLLSFSFQPDVIEHPDQVLAKLANKDDVNYDLILTDYNMPQMDGIELLENIRAISDIPVILLTSFGFGNDIYNATKYINTSYLIKPIKQSQLFDAIVKLLDSSIKTGLTSSQKQITSQTENFQWLKRHHNNIKILLAEDNMVNQKLAVALMKKAGLTVDVADDGKIAIDFLKINRYDVVLMDVQMPNLDGFSATNKIRTELNLHSLPIIAMTAHAMKGDKERCLAAGMDDYIAKPIEPVELYNILFKWISKN